ncbi:mucin-4 isoform X2 [Saimiri boliviensis]|uniref:mucin-4 isoform X2 n=1 Tax=Saimiri boliviensis TaxID=27679 RepID=UPI003D76BEAB
MGLPCWRRVPWVSLSCLCLCLLPHVVLGTTELLPSSFSSRHSSTKSNPYETSPSGEATTSPHSSVRSTFLMTSRVPQVTTSTDSTPGTTEETSTPGRENTALIPSAGSVTATLAGQSTATSLRTSNQEISASSQNHQTHGMETSREAQTTTLTQMSTSPLSSPPSVHNVTAAVSQETAPPGEITSSSPASVTNTPVMTPEVTSFTDSTLGNIGETSTPVTESLRPVTSAVSVTGESEGQSAETSSRSSIQGTTAFSQNQQNQSTETTRESQTSTLTQMITSTLSSSPRVHSVTGTVAQETSPPAEKTTSSLFSVSNTPMISKTRIMTTFTESTFNNTEETSTPGTVSSTPVPSAASITAEPEGQSTATASRTSTLDTSSFSQNHQTQSMETTRDAQTSTLSQRTTSTPSFSPSVLNVTDTVSQETSPPDEKTTSFPFSGSNTPILTSKIITMTTFAESTFHNTEETTPVTEGFRPVTSAVSIKGEPEGQSPENSSRSTIQGTTAFSQNHQTQSTETTRESLTTTLTQMPPSTPFYSPREHNATGTVSQETSTPAETTTSSPSSFSNTPVMTSKHVTMTTSTDSTLGNTGETSAPLPGSFMPATSVVSITAEPEGQSSATSLRTSAQDTSAFSQNHQSQSTETTRDAQASTLSQRTMPTLSSSPSVLNVTDTVPQETSPPEEVTTSFPSSVSNTLIMKSKTVTVTTLTESTCNITEETSAPGTRSPTPVPSAASITAEPEGQSAAASSRTSIWDTSASSQNYQTQSTETTRESQTSILTQMITSAPSFSPSAHNVTGTVSQDTSPPGETATSSLSSVTNIPMMISKTITMTTFTNSTLGNTAETSTPLPETLTPVTSASSITAEPGQSLTTSSRTFHQDTTAFSQNHQNQNMETTRDAPTSTLPQRTTPTPSSSTSVSNVAGTVAEETSLSGEKTTSSSSSVSNTSMMTSKAMTMTTFTEATPKNTEEIATPGTKSPTPVPSAASVTAEPEGQSPATSSRISASDTTDFSQNPQSQSMETTIASDTDTLTQKPTLSLSSSPGVLDVTETGSWETSPPDEMATSSPDSVSNTLMMTSTMPSSTESTLKSTEEISTPGTKLPSLIISAASITAEPEGQSPATASTFSTRDPAAFSQNHQTQSMESTRESQTSALTQRTTSTLSPSPRVLNVTESVSWETSPPDEMATSSPYSVTNTPMMTSKTITMTTSTDSTLGNPEETSTPGTKSPAPVTSAASITAEPEGQSIASSSKASTQDIPAFSQNHQTQSMDTTRESQTTTVTGVVTSAPLTSPRRHTPTGSFSQETAHPDEMATASLSSFSNTPMMASKVVRRTTSTRSTLENTGEASAPVTGSLMPVTSVASMTAEPEGESPATFSGTSTQHTAAFPQNQQTHGMGTTGVSQINTLTLVASTVLSSPSGLNLSGTVSQETLPSGGTTTSSPSSDSSTFPAASEVSGTPASTESTLGNTEETSLSVSGSISAITSKVSTVWWSDALSTALSPTSLPPELSTALHTHLSEGAETTGRPHESSSVSPSASQETFTPREATWTSSLSSEGSTTWLPKELPSTPPSAATVLVTGSPATWTAGTIPRVPSEVSTTGEPGQPATRPSHSTTLPETTGAGAQTQWTQETGTTGEVRVHSPRYGVTQMTEAATSPSSSPMLDGHTQQITMAPSTYRSTIHPVSTSPQRSSAVSQSGHTPASKTTRESQTTRSISPVTDGFQTATTPASSFTASQHPPSEMAPQDASTISAATTFTPAPTRDGHTTQARTTALQAAPSSPDATLGPSGRTSPSITGAIPPATSVVSTPVGAEGRWTAASASASPNTAPAMTQTHQARGTEASGGTQTSQPASSGSGTIAAGSATPSSSRTSGTTPSGSHGMSTSGETTWFSPRPSRDTHTPQSTSGLPSPSASHGVTPESTGTGSPSASPDATPASTGTGSPSASPDVTPASTGTGSPSASPDAAPASTGTGSPSASPDATPASTGTGSPSSSPDATPASTGTGCPSASPDATPASTGTGSPSASPDATPASTGTGSPSASPDATPASTGTGSPSASPDVTPASTGTGSPSASPDVTPASTGTGSPSASPDATPTSTGTGSPSASPDATPTSTGTGSPSASPDATPESMGTGSPSAIPDATPESMGTGSPSAIPDATPESMGTGSPSASPDATPESMGMGSPSASPDATPESMGMGSPSASPDATSESMGTGSPSASPDATPESMGMGSPSASHDTTPASTGTGSPSASPDATPESMGTGSPSASPDATPASTGMGSPSASHDATPGSGGTGSTMVPFSPTLSPVPTAGRPPGEASLTSPSPVSWAVQTRGTGDGRGSPATPGSSTPTAVPPRFAFSGQTSPQPEARTGSPSWSRRTLSTALVGDSRGPWTAGPAQSPEASPSTLRDVTPPAPSTVVSSREGLAATSRSWVIRETAGVAVLTPVHAGHGALTMATWAPALSGGVSGMPSPEHPPATQGGAPATNPTARSTHRSSTRDYSDAARATPTPSVSPVQTTPEASSASQHPESADPTPPPSGDVAPSSHTSPARTTPGFSPSGSHSSFSPAAPGPAATPSSATRFTGHATPLPVTSTSSASTVSSGPALMTETPGMTTPSLKTDSGRNTAASLPPTTSRTITSAIPNTSTDTRSTAAPVPIPSGKGVSLLPYGSGAGDLEFVRRTVDFASPLFKPLTGFPLGSSLRDSLYFTDNGQIIFPESDYQIFSYPNPLPTGFTGWDPVALVAPFWDDADFSNGQGTIFYREYETLYGEHNPLVLQTESWIRKITSNGDYEARWTLKVTWVGAHAYPAQWSLGTNTYQAVLSTDGSRSYALFLYQSGGMQWDAARQAGSPVLTGFSSGDGSFENSPLMFQPVWEKYRPDRLLNSNLGLRGLQFYRLHREERPNYRLMCLQWLRSQPQRPSWGWNQVSCPCSWQQGRWDLRFRPVSIGRWAPGSRQLCSFTSWRGGVCCSYGPWGELLEGWHVQSPQQFGAQELEPQSWCCRWNDKPYLCALYQQRRPRVGCAAHRPPRPAWMFGDPHITTLDGVNYTFNGLGDFLLVQAQDGNSSFQLQGRTAQTGSAQATNFIAFAAQYRSSSLEPVTVQWLLEPHDRIRVLLDNRNVTFEPDHEDDGGPETFSAPGVLLSRSGPGVSASFDGSAAVSVTALSGVLHAAASLPPGYRGRTAGLLGIWNNNPEDDFRMPNGSTIPPSSSEAMLFHYGMTWKINGTGLLGKRNDQLPSNFTPAFYDQLQTNSSWDEDLISSCSGDRSCIYDALATRNASIGLHTLALRNTYERVNATLNQYPPSIKGSRVVEAYKGQTVLIQYTSNAEDVTFMLRDNCTDLKLFKNGTLLWTPKSLKPFSLEILARSAKTNLSSALQPRTTVCHCTAKSQCLYNQTSRVGGSSLEVAGCKCDRGTFGRYCERSADACEEPCFLNVSCIPGKGCEACPPGLTGDGRHCAEVEEHLPGRGRVFPCREMPGKGEEEGLGFRVAHGRTWQERSQACPRARSLCRPLLLTSLLLLQLWAALPSVGTSPAP